MACENYREFLVGSLYDELEPQERETLASHLETCDSCRRELQDLESARGALRLANPEVPATSRVVVLSPKPRRSTWLWSFAAGFASAAVVLGVGIAIGMQMLPSPGAGGEEGVIPYAQAGLPGDYVTRTELQQALAARDASLDERFRTSGDQWRGTLLADLGREPSFQAYIDDRLGRFETTLDERRRSDLSFVMSEIAQSEIRAGYAIDEAQQTLRYVALANHPDLSEW
jgi:hypothetical protein